jgi:tRNA(fMet)-specific endonuclease VapC
MRRALLDTDILSEVLKGKNPQVAERASAYLGAYNRLTISVVTLMEVVKGLRKVGREEPLRRFEAGLYRFDVLPFDAEAASLAGRIYGDLERVGQPIGRADPMIAATALRHGLVLVTGNEAHYERIVRAGHALAIENWRRTDA